MVLKIISINSFNWPFLYLCVWCSPVIKSTRLNH